MTGATSGPSSLLDAAASVLARARADAHANARDLIGRPVADVTTPALLLDRAALARNLDRMASALAPTGIALRPHVKVHKSPEIAHLQVAAGARGLSAATTWEAAILAADGLDDLFVVNTVGDPVRAAALAELARERRILVAVDAAAGVAILAAATRAAGSTLAVVVEVDTGMGRCGVETPDEASALAAVVAGTAGLDLAGVTGYEGHCSMEDDVARRADLHAAAMRRLLDARDAITAAGLPCPVVSAGGTRTWWLGARTAGLTELQAGTYALVDEFHADVPGGFEPALTVASRVISCRPDRIVIDAGSKTVGDYDLARIVGHELPVIRGDEEHGIYAGGTATGAGLAVGDLVRVIPGYAPTTVNAFDAYLVVEEDRVVDAWPVVPRGPGDHGLAAALRARAG